MLHAISCGILSMLLHWLVPLAFAHLDVVDYFDVDRAGDPLDTCPISGYFTFVGSNIVIWRSIK